MTPEARRELEFVKQQLRCASIAKIGGFRPPADPLTSWFGRGVALDGELAPCWRGKPMFPLLQIRVSELPFIPDALVGTEMLVLFMNGEEHPFDLPHGDGWEIREYASLERLQAMPTDAAAKFCRAFPIRWELVIDDSPSWEDAWELVDLHAVNKDPEATHEFFFGFNRYPGTKVGGFPNTIQHGAGTSDFIFQVGSEEKACWMWADNGIGYFFKSPEGVWSWACQFY